MMGAVKQIILPILFVLVFAVSRIPGLLPLGFTAAYALVFCAGVYFRGAMAWWLPLGVMAATDIGLNIFYHYKYNTPVFQSRAPAQLRDLCGTDRGGQMVRHNAPFWKLLLGGILGAAMFYLLTNTLSWLMDPHYAKTMAGWIQALFTGLPGYPPSWEFFRNTLLSGGDIHRAVRGSGQSHRGIAGGKNRRRGGSRKRGNGG